MLSLPGLILLGLSPEVAIATNKMADLGRFTSSSYQFIKSKKVVWKYVRTLASLAAAAGYVGARILLEIDQAVVGKMIGIMMLALVPLIFTKRELGTVQTFPDRTKIVSGHIVYFLVSIYGAAIQLGSGPMLLYVVMWFLGLTILQANATSSFCWLFITVTSLVTFVVYGVVNYWYGTAILLGSICGGYLGAHTAVRQGDAWTKRFFAVVITIMAVKLLLFTG